MAFDGIVTAAVVNELREKLTGGKIEKIYQPEADELVFNIHTTQGNLKLYISCNSAHARAGLISGSLQNPEQPMSFCMLLRKHLSGGRITGIQQKDTERIIELEIETFSEMGFSLRKKLIAEIMGKHSNIILIDDTTGKIIDSIKRISLDINRVRQILPGKLYEYPPDQGKTPLANVNEELCEKICKSGGSLSSGILNSVQGLSPLLCSDIAERLESRGINAKALFGELSGIRMDLETNNVAPVVYEDAGGAPIDFHVFRLFSLDECYKPKEFDTPSAAIEYYFLHKVSSNKVRQKSNDLERAIKTGLDKLYLKKQRLSEDLLKAENSEDMRLYGELIMANLHLIKSGSEHATVVNYYDNKEITIPLDKRFNAVRNSQLYFKKYGKAKTSIKEKSLQLEDTNRDIEYLESVLAFAEAADQLEVIEEIRSELITNGYLRKRKNSFQAKKKKAPMLEYHTREGFKVIAGRNNTENDVLTFKMASPKDFWFHTKDIPGSHVILFTEGSPLTEELVYQAASIAAYHSKGKNSKNVPVDYVQVRYVKKPNGAKPGMVIFTNNRTVYVDPKLTGIETAG